MENELVILSSVLEDNSSDDSPSMTKGRNSIPLDDESWVLSPKGSTTQCEFKRYSIQGLTSIEPWGSVPNSWEKPPASRSPVGRWQRGRSAGKNTPWVITDVQYMHACQCCKLHRILMLLCAQREIISTFSHKATNSIFTSFSGVRVICKNADRRNMISLCSHH